MQQGNDKKNNGKNLNNSYDITGIIHYSSQLWPIRDFGVAVMPIGLKCLLVIYLLTYLLFSYQPIVYCANPLSSMPPYRLS